MAFPPPETPTSLGPEEVRRLQADHAAAMTALEAALSDTTRLTRLLNILSEGAPLERLLNRVLSALSEIFSSDVVALLQRGSEQSFVPRAAVGIPEDQLARPLPGAPGTYLARSIEARGPVQVENLGADVTAAAEVSGVYELGARTVLWLPAVGDDGVEAVFLLARCRVQLYAQTDLDLLGAMAYRIAVVLERARAETKLREAQDRLLQTERLALVGKLSGSMAHELNNPLAAVRSNLEQLHGQVPALAGVFRAAARASRLLDEVPGEEAREVARELRAFLEAGDTFAVDVEEMVADSLESVRRMGQLVGSLLRIFAAERFEPERLDLRVAVAECVADLPADTGRPALVQEPGDGAPCVAWIAASAFRVAFTGVLRMILSPGLRRTDPTRTVVIRVGHDHGRPAVVVTDPVLELDREEQRAIFDPHMEEVETPRGRSVRLSLMAMLSYQLFRGCGTDVSTEAPGAEGLTVRVVLPSPP